MLTSSVCSWRARPTTREQGAMWRTWPNARPAGRPCFLMQPHEETQRATRTPAKGWVWGWLLPVGVPAAALACGLIAVFLYIRPRDRRSSIPQQVASVRHPEMEGPGTTAAPSADSDRCTIRDKREASRRQAILRDTKTRVCRNLRICLDQAGERRQKWLLPKRLRPIFLPALRLGMRGDLRAV